MKIEVRYLKSKTNGITYTYYEEVEGIDFMMIILNSSIECY